MRALEDASGVDDAVFGATHAAQLGLEWRQAGAEGDEHQAGVVGVDPRHGAAQHEARSARPAAICDEKTLDTVKQSN